MKKPRKSKAQKAAPAKAAATRKAHIAKMSPRQLQHLKQTRHQAAVKAAATRKKEVEKFKRTHHGTPPAPGQLHPQPRQPRKLVAASVGDRWIVGGNDDHDSCVQAAFANSLYLLTGFRVSDEEVLTLFGSEATTLSEALESLMRNGLGGVYPHGFIRAPYLVPGAVLGVSLPEPHTVVYDDDGLITWGGKIEHGCAVEEAYLIVWPEQERT